jgi:hypothetical protein
MRTRVVGLVALLALSGCVTKTTPPATDADADAAEAPARGRNRDIITRQELQVPSITGLTVLDAIRTLRPHFLTNRGLSTVPVQGADMEVGRVHASIDGTRVVTVDELANLRAGTVAEIRLLSPAAAMQKFGSNSRQGPVILVRTM